MFLFSMFMAMFFLNIAKHASRRLDDDRDVIGGPGPDISTVVVVDIFLYERSTGVRMTVVTNGLCVKDSG